MTRWYSTVVLCAVLAASATAAAVDPPPDVLLQQAIHKQLVEGDLGEAIRLYGEILEKHASNRPVAAKALLHTGEAYEKLGKGEASKAYERLVRDYADQVDEARKASARLAALRVRDDALPITGTRRVWEGKGVDPSGTPSRDGALLTFVDWDTGDLAIRDLRSGENRRLTNKGTWLEASEFAENSIFSPDAKSIAYAWFNADGRYDLRLVGTSSGSAPRTLFRDADSAWVQPFRFSSDGRRVLTFIERWGKGEEIALVGLDGTYRKVVDLGSRPPLGADLSPDARWVVFDQQTAEAGTDRDLYMVNLATGQRRPLVVHPAVDYTPLFTPDGKSVVFISDRTGSPSLWLVDVANGEAEAEPVLLKPDMDRAYPMAFTADGTLFYTLRTGLRDVLTASFDLGAGKVIGEPKPAADSFVGRSFAPDWSWNGKFISYSSQRGTPQGGSGARLLVIRSLEDGAVRELTPRLTYFHRPRWTPDGRFLTVSGAINMRHGFYNVDSSTGAVTPLALSEPGHFFFHATWSPDGKKLYYTHGEMKKVWIAERSIETGEERIVFTPQGVGVNDMALSPDGKTLAFRMGAGYGVPSSLNTIDLGSGAVRQLVAYEMPRMIPSMSGIGFSPDGRFLLFVLAEDASTNPVRRVMRIAADGGEPQDTGLRGDRLTELRFHPSGEKVAVTVGQNTVEIWALHNFLPRREVKRAPR